MHDDEGPVLRFQVCEGPIEKVPIRQETDGVAWSDGLMGRHHLEDDPAAPAATRLVDAAVHEETVQPGIEVRRVA